MSAYNTHIIELDCFSAFLFLLNNKQTCGHSREGQKWIVCVIEISIASL